MTTVLCANFGILKLCISLRLHSAYCQLRGALGADGVLWDSPVSCFHYHN